MPKYTAESINHGSKNVARFFFATRLSKNEEKWKDINKTFQKLKKNGVAAFFFGKFVGENWEACPEKNEHVKQKRKSSAIAFVWNFCSEKWRKISQYEYKQTET